MIWFKQEIINTDLYRIHGVINRQYFKKCMNYPGFKYQYYFRMWNLTKSKILKYYYSIKIKKYSMKFGFQILPHTKIGSGFRIYHFGNIIINPHATIGNNCSIYPNVIIGNIDHGSKKGTPQIGDKVWIGANSIIVGNIKIGNDVLIAPGAFVNFDVPPNSVVVGNPGKIIFKVNPTKGYIENIYKNN